MKAKRLKRRLREAVKRKINRTDRRDEGITAESPKTIDLSTGPWKSALGNLGTEVWRLGRRLGASDNISDRIQESHRGLMRCLDELGVRVDDPIGDRYFEGMNVDLIDLPDGADPANEVMIITDVLRPAVFVNGICVVTPQIIVERQEDKEKPNGTRHD